MQDLVGSDLNDTLIGDAGRNRLVGCDGNDVLDGTGGRDVASFGCVFPEGVHVDLGAGTATGEGTDTLTNIEHLRGTNGPDVLVGDAANNRFDGRYGDDSLSGGEGDDRLLGRWGADSLFGEAGDDFLNGGPQTDSGDGGAHVVGDTCREIEVPTNCELS